MAYSNNSIKGPNYPGGSWINPESASVSSKKKLELAERQRKERGAQVKDLALYPLALSLSELNQMELADAFIKLNEYQALRSKPKNEETAKPGLAEYLSNNYGIDARRLPENIDFELLSKKVRDIHQSHEEKFLQNRFLHLNKDLRNQIVDAAQHLVEMGAVITSEEWMNVYNLMLRHMEQRSTGAVDADLSLPEICKRAGIKDYWPRIRTRQKIMQKNKKANRGDLTPRK